MRKALIMLLLLAAIPTVGKAQLNQYYFIWVAENLIQERQAQDAINTINILLRSNPEVYEAYTARGWAKLSLGDPMGARADFIKSLEINPLHSRTYEIKAAAEIELGNHSAAYKDIDEAIALSPRRAGPYYIRGTLFLMDGRFENALSDLNRTLNIDNSIITAYTQRANSYLGMGDTIKAFDDLNTAIKMDLKNPTTYNRRGALYLDMDNYPKAIEDFDRALAIDSIFTPAYLNRGIAHLHTNETALSVKDFNTAIRLDPSNWRAFFIRSLIFSDAGATATALKDLDRSLEINPVNPRAYFNRALLLTNQGELKAALENYNHASFLLPDNVKILYNRALTYIRLNDYDNALMDINRTLELFPDFARVYFVRSHIKSLKGDVQGAERDREYAEAKNIEYTQKYTPQEFERMADTSSFFRQVMSFNHNIQSEAYSLNIIRQQTDFRPSFRLTFATPSAQNPRLSCDQITQQVEWLRSESGIPNVIFSERFDSIPADSLTMMEKKLGGDMSIPTSARTLLNGVILGLRGEYAKAAQEINPDDGSLLAHISKGVILGEMTDFARSLDDRQFGRIYNYDDAIGQLDKAAELSPDCAYIYYNRGNIYASSGLMPKAIEDYTKAIKLDPRLGSAYFNRGLALLHIKETSPGILDISKAGECGVKEAYNVLRMYSAAGN